MAIGWSEGPLGDVDRIRREMQRLGREMRKAFGEYGQHLPDAIRAAVLPFVGPFPPVNVSTTPEAVVVRAEVPGVDIKDLEITVVGDGLTIAGIRREDPALANASVHRQEREFGCFSRVIALPAKVDATKTPDASYKDGVLTVVCPKAEEAKPKRVEVKAS
ncbi:MAG: Hsp20/alpha crystallin family protein [Planctomycetes bacterium]|nr:Hsp20/alpha crystallin family protein [Planctomycetota bacterium]